MKLFRILLLIFSLTLASAACDSNAPPPSREATFEGLGDLPGGTVWSEADGVSADGRVVVGAAGVANGSEAFRWVADSAGEEGGVMTGLGELSGGIFYSLAQGASSDGTVAVGTSSSASGTEAFRWEGGTMTGLGDLPGGAFGSGAYGVSADGAVVVGISVSANGEEAYRWEGGAMTALGDLPGGAFLSRAYGVSADGSVAVGLGTSGNGPEAFRWQNGSMTALGDLPGGQFSSRATAVSADGAVVVGRSESAGGNEAFRWEGGAMTALGDLPGGAFSSEAGGVSVDGSVVIGTGDSDAGIEAFIWTQADGMRNLREVLEEDYNLDLTGWVLETAEGISNDGMFIVGHGTNPDGRGEAWRAFLGEPVTSNQ